ncbi:hypothetical protein GOBAR_DD34034 [Gossypium barbadense]|nr:hypothetical protein GOBAR_DD34034 [Gossypium barbadense]
MVNVPSLVSLSIDALKRELIHGDDLLPHVYELPLELFNSLVECLPPLALQKLQSEMPFKNYDDYGPSSDDLKMGSKMWKVQKLMGSTPFDLAKFNMVKSREMSRNAPCPCGSKKRYKR